VSARGGRGFTGRHAIAVIGGGFAVVVAVNLTLALLASRSHPGMVVENSYVASQKFNGWLAEGRAQKALGWQVTAALDGDRLLVEARSARDTPLQGLRAVATLSHPFGAGAARTIALVETAPGRYEAPHGLAPGAWTLELRLTRGPERFYLEQRLAAG
jgi:nitrogen fixation protein FixH